MERANLVIRAWGMVEEIGRSYCSMDVVCQVCKDKMWKWTDSVETWPTIAPEPSMLEYLVSSWRSCLGLGDMAFLGKGISLKWASGFLKTMPGQVCLGLQLLGKMWALTYCFMPACLVSYTPPWCSGLTLWNCERVPMKCFLLHYLGPGVSSY